MHTLDEKYKKNDKPVYRCFRYYRQQLMTPRFTDIEQDNHRKPHRRLWGQAGFSLTEVMIVLGILSILAAIAIPSFMNWLPRYRLKAGARDLYSNLQKARIGAIKSNKQWAIVFDAAGDRYHLCSDPGGDNTWSSIADNTVEETIRLADYQSGVQYGHGTATTPMGGAFDDEITYNSNVASFNPKGTGSSGYVYLENEKNTTYAIGSQASGVIILKIWDGSSWE